MGGFLVDVQALGLNQEGDDKWVSAKVNKIYHEGSALVAEQQCRARRWARSGGTAGEALKDQD